MPDITMCANHTEGCTQAKTCYRATAKPGERQSYAPLYIVGRDSCDDYSPDWSAFEPDGGRPFPESTP